MLTTGKKAASLYIHVPFCKKKCPYCHFFVVPDSLAAQDAFMAALDIELTRVLPSLADFQIVSLYFGGGTPSLLGAKKVAAILDKVAASLDLADSIEITLEANPEGITLQSMQAFKAAGINRVSMGLQAMDDNLLQILGRTHTSAASASAVETTFASGIENISVDLMYELPHQDLSHWQTTLKSIQALPITHLSLYNLVIEPHTVFAKKEKALRPHIPPADVGKKMLEIAKESLQKMGLCRYEISAFAKPGYQSVHNTGYWTARPFLGVGPSAFSYYQGARYQNICHLQKYCKMLHDGISPVDFFEKLSYPESIKELLAVELRLLAGVDIKTFEERHGPLPPSTLASLTTLCTKGWINKDKGCVRLTDEGILFYDSVAEEII
jgi:oxygen-independent coproporphyrinogen-3 oxidase